MPVFVAGLRKSIDIELVRFREILLHVVRGGKRDEDRAVRRYFHALDLERVHGRAHVCGDDRVQPQHLHREPVGRIDRRRRQIVADRIDVREQRVRFGDDLFPIGRVLDQLVDGESHHASQVMTGDEHRDEREPEVGFG